MTINHRGELEDLDSRLLPFRFDTSNVTRFQWAQEGKGPKKHQIVKRSTTLVENRRQPDGSYKLQTYDLEDRKHVKAWTTEKATTQLFNNFAEAGYSPNNGRTKYAPKQIITTLYWDPLIPDIQSRKVTIMGIPTRINMDSNNPGMHPWTWKEATPNEKDDLIHLFPTEKTRRLR